MKTTAQLPELRGSAFYLLMRRAFETNSSDLIDVIRRLEGASDNAGQSESTIAEGAGANKRGLAWKWKDKNPKKPADHCAIELKAGGSQSQSTQLVLGRWCPEIIPARPVEGKVFSKPEGQ